MRDIDRLTSERYDIPSLVLMENAASAVVRVIVSGFGGEMAGKTALVLCGRGNNGGDGAAVARLLAHAGANVSAVLFGTIEGTKGDARTNFEALASLVDSTESVPGAIRFVECGIDSALTIAEEDLARRMDVIVDGLFGTGLSRPLEGIYAHVVERVNEFRKRATSSGPVVAIDVPSGLN